VKEKVPEVFHVSNNLYNYEESQTICKSFDSRLATYDEVENRLKIIQQLWRVLWIWLE
jgi:uncharacterized membrane protein YjjP (DUF1212 family)